MYELASVVGAFFTGVALGAYIRHLWVNRKIRKFEDVLKVVKEIQENGQTVEYLDKTTTLFENLVMNEKISREG